MAPKEVKTPESLALQCPQCKKIGNCPARGSYLFNSKIISDDDPLQIVFLECSNCKYPLLIERYWDTDLADFRGFNFMFPRRRAATGYAPNAVNEAYREAIKCRDVHAYTAAVLMCRRALEAVAIDKEANGKSLFDRVDHLRRSSVISDDIFEWFTLLREMGNEAAHSQYAHHSEQDADDAIDFTLAIMEFVYTYRERFKSFKSRAAKAV